MNNKIENGFTDDHRKGNGLSFWTAAVFVVGEVAGAGILSLPHATSQSGWSGLAIIVFCGFCAAISGICLAKSWLILEERYPRYRKGLTRKPFATIGFHAFGKYMSATVSIVMSIARIGSGTVFLLVSSSLIHSLTHSFIHLSYCQWMPIVMAILLVPLWLGSPVDFWPIAYTAMISSCFGSILLIISLIVEISKHGIGHDFHVENFETFSGAFGTILFAYSGVSAFPNFQNDMKEKEKFPAAVILGFTILLMLYLPISALGYAGFGFGVTASIIDEIPAGVIVTIVKLCFCVHCTTVIFIFVNPVFLDLEELFKIPKAFNWKRCVLRTVIVVLIIFIAETFPSFGQILDLIGGATISLLAFVFPPIFYVKICLTKSDKWPQRNIPSYMLSIYAVIVLAAIFGGISSTVTTLRHWIPLESACYVSKK